MSREWVPASPLEVLGSIAVLDVLLRVVADLLLVLDATVLPEGVLLASRLATGSSAVGWLLGWLLLGLATFQALPEVFPEDATRVGNDVVKRAVVAAGAVGAGLYLDTLVASFPVLGAARFQPGVLWLVGSLLAVAVPVFLAADVSVTPVTRYVYYRGSADEEQPLPVGRTVLVSRTLLVVVLAGFVLAVVSRLFPLPEVLVLGVAARQRLAPASRPREPGDLAERLMRGIRSIWAGPKGVVGVGYGLVAMLSALTLTLGYLRALVNDPDPLADPLAAVFLLATLGVGTLFVVVATTRAIERLPASVGVATEGDELVGPRIPGLLLPGTALFALYEANREGATDSLQHTLTVAPGDLAVALVVAAVALVLLAKPLLVPRLPVSDYLAVPVSAALAMGIVSTMLGLEQGTYEFGAATPVVLLYVFVLAYLSPFLGYEAFNSDRWEDDADAESETTFFRLASEAFVAGAVFVGAVVGGIVLRLVLFFAPPELVGVVISTVMIPALFGVAIRLALLPLYLPEQLGEMTG